MDLPTLRGVLEKRGINAIGPALGPDTDDDVISALLSETGPADRSLRIALKTVLQQRLGRESSAYQQASFGLLAAHVREGKRAFASELVGGNESATLNDDVIAARIDAEDGAERVAAAQVMRPRHLPLLEARLATEPEGETREKLVEAGRRIAGEPGAPPTALLSAEDRLTAMARRFGRAKGWLRWATAADSLGADPAALRACVTGASAIFAAHPEGFYAAEGRRPPAPDAFDARLTSLTVSAALPQTKLPKKLTFRRGHAPPPARPAKPARAPTPSHALTRVEAAAIFAASSAGRPSPPSPRPGCAPRPPCGSRSCATGSASPSSPRGSRACGSPARAASARSPRGR
ncbi:MAG: hypothetical protein VYE22_24655 [Myxococcota bacterium]|nr:hypothetical protein [Myxococcota bacterium]